MTTNRVYLIKRPRTLPCGKRAHYWVLRWYGTDGKQYSESLGRTDEITKRDAEAQRREKEVGFGAGTMRVDKPKAMTLTNFRTIYKERRAKGDMGNGRIKGAPKLDPQTISEHDMTLRYLIRHFGEHCLLASVNLGSAEAFIDALERGDLAAERKPRSREYTTSENTIRKHIRNAKAIYNWANRFRYVNANPFKDFDGTPQQGGPNHYLPLADFEKLMGATTKHNWRALFALCRLGGLRLGEALRLPWTGKATDKHGDEHSVGIDWHGRRIRLVANKGKAAIFRIVPMSNRLHDILLEAFEAAADGSTLVCGGLTRNNVERNVDKIIKAAQLTKWSKPYQAMRSSCENDWKKMLIAEATYCTWLGHSATVSRKNYVSPTEAEFELVTKAAA